MEADVYLTNDGGIRQQPSALEDVPWDTVCLGTLRMLLPLQCMSTVVGANKCLCGLLLHVLPYLSALLFLRTMPTFDANFRAYYACGTQRKLAI